MRWGRRADGQGLPGVPAGRGRRCGAAANPLRNQADALMFKRSIGLAYCRRDRVMEGERHASHQSQSERA